MSGAGHHRNHGGRSLGRGRLVPLPRIGRVRGTTCAIGGVVPGVVTRRRCGKGRELLRRSRRALGLACRRIPRIGLGGPNVVVLVFGAVGPVCAAHPNPFTNWAREDGTSCAGYHIQSSSPVTRHCGRNAETPCCYQVGGQAATRGRPVYRCARRSVTDLPDSFSRCELCLENRGDALATGSTDRDEATDRLPGLLLLLVQHLRE